MLTCKPMRAAIAVTMLLASLAAAHAFGLGNEGKGFGRLGSVNNKKTAAAATPCSGTGLDFSTTCNSQYIGIL